MVDGFILTFSFEDDFPYIDLALQIVKKKKFENVTSLTWQQPYWVSQIENEYLTADEEEDMRNIDIQESKVYREVNGLELEILDIMKPLNTKKVNIGSEKEPNFAIIIDYWDEETVSKVTKLIHEYQELFPPKVFHICKSYNSQARNNVFHGHHKFLAIN